MISCAYALLFTIKVYSDNQQTHDTTNIPKRITSDLESLVILGEGNRGSSYGAYEIPSNRHFPNPNPTTDIVTTYSSVVHGDAEVTAYCSPSLSSNQIFDTIVRELIPISRTQNLESKPAFHSEQQCWKRIRKDWINRADEPSPNQVVLAQNEDCSSSSIIRLAHEGFLSVSGIYNEFAPPNGDRVPTVEITTPFDLRRMVPNRQTMGKWDEGKRQMILGWYFGHPHIFKLDPISEMWWPVTNVNEHQNNVGMILKFMREKMNIFRELNQLLQESKRLSRVPRNCLPRASCNHPDDKDKINEILAEISCLELEIIAKYPRGKLSNCYIPQYDNRLN